MSTSRRNPAHMNEAARVAELGALLARGFRRVRRMEQKGLAETADSERPCDPRVNTRETKEVA